MFLFLSLFSIYLFIFVLCAFRVEHTIFSDFYHFLFPTFNSELFIGVPPITHSTHVRNVKKLKVAIFMVFFCHFTIKNELFCPWCV